MSGAVGGPRLGRRTLQVLAVMLDEDRSMYSREIAERIPDMQVVDITQYLKRLRRRGWVVSEPRYGESTQGPRIRTYNRLTRQGREGAIAALGRVEVPAQRRGSPRHFELQPELDVRGLAERCDIAARALVERSHINRAEPEQALRDVATVLNALSRGLAGDPDPVMVKLAGRFGSLGKSCALAADRWAGRSSSPDHDYDMTWQTLRAVSRVLRELTTEQPTAAAGAGR